MPSYSAVARCAVTRDDGNSKSSGSTDSQSSRQSPTDTGMYASTDDHSAQASQGKAKVSS